MKHLNSIFSILRKVDIEQYNTEGTISSQFMSLFHIK